MSVNTSSRSYGKSLFFRYLSAAVLAATIPGPATTAQAQDGLQELRGLVVTSNGRPGERDLQLLESKWSGSRAGALARFLRGYLYHSGQSFSSAVEAFDPGVISANSAIGDYALFYRAESESKLGQKAAALRDYTQLYAHSADSILARDARVKAGELAVALGDAPAALEAVKPLAGAGNADALFVAAQATERGGNRDAAVTMYRKIYFDFAASGMADRAAEQLRTLGVGIDQNPASLAEARARADALFDSKQYPEAAQAYAEMQSRFPETAGRQDVMLRRGVSLLNSRQTSEAVQMLAKAGSGNSALSSEALFYEIEALRKQNQPGQAAVILERLLSQYPKSRWAPMSLYNQATALDKADRDAEAAARFRQLLRDFPTSEYAPEASYYLGWASYRAKQYAEAARILEKHLSDYRSPGSKFIGEAGFWAGKSRERLGDRARALFLYESVAERYRYGYHGYIAGQRAKLLRTADPTLKAEQPKAGSDLERIRQGILHFEKVRETDDGSSGAHVVKADELELIGLGDLAITEINEALKSAPASPRLNLRLAQTYSRRGETFQATLILRRAYPDLFSYQDGDLPREAWEIFFPIRHWDLIKSESKRYGLDPYLVAGLIRQESVFNPTAISRVGARGLMQLMPTTAQQVAKHQGIQPLGIADLYNPVLNIKLGMNFLSQRVGEFGRTEYAAASYNAGPGRVQQWLKERGSLDIEDWVETIPFAETRGYVQGVIRNAANYRRLYKE
ncbi:MAG TPA: transglycosylase SLT domain-containing protein [Blastocatellia bacterium]|nr:transglycosylase SLT domain-containing protein [Blastocatellia bacterium]